MKNLDALDLRFAETLSGLHRNVAGVVGLVRGVEPPLALHVVLGSTDPERAATAGERGIAETRRSIHAASLLLAARKMDLGGDVEAILGVMRADYAERGRDGDYWWLEACEPGEAEATVANSLRGALGTGDAFRVAKRMCDQMQVPGEMGLLRAVEPACLRLLDLADEEHALVEAAAWIERRKREGSRDFSRHADAWQEAVSQSPPSP